MVPTAGFAELFLGLGDANEKHQISSEGLPHDRRLAVCHILRPDGRPFILHRRMNEDV